jgi:endo-1,4-beta-xylanase
VSRPAVAPTALLVLAIIAGSCVPVVATGPRAPDAATPQPSPAGVRTGPPLLGLAARDRLLIGTAVNMDYIDSEPDYRASIGTEFSSVTPENVMKWKFVEAARGQLDFSSADELVRFARAHGQRVRGHTLVWTDQLPGWLTNGSFTPAELGQMLHQHITDEVSHFRGEVAQWDVVNEALDDDGSLRDTMWLRALGPGYIADAFRWAHDADPDAELFYNDFGIEGLGPKSDAARALVRQLRDEGLRIDGVGIQSHLSLSLPIPTTMQQNLRRFGDMGVQTEITEADVRIPLPVDTPKLEAQAGVYGLLIDACLATPRCTGMTVWGFTDHHSWIPSTYQGYGAADLLDDAYRPKPAYDALRAALFLAAPARRATRTG